MNAGPLGVDPIYAWQVKDAGDGNRWGTIGYSIPGMGEVTPLICRSPDIAEKMRPLAEAHGRATGYPIRLVRFEFAEVLP